MGRWSAGSVDRGGDEPLPFTIRLRGDIELGVRAQSPEMACEQVARLHEALGPAILQVRGPNDVDWQSVRGRCVQCREWVFGDWRSRAVKCKRCTKGGKLPRPVKERLPRATPPDRNGGPRGSGERGGQQADDY